MKAKKVKLTITIETSSVSTVCIDKALERIMDDIRELGAVRYLDATGQLLCRAKISSVERRKK